MIQTAADQLAGVVLRGRCDKELAGYCVTAVAC
jgi:hypothetical protein